MENAVMSQPTPTSASTSIQPDQQPSVLTWTGRVLSGSFALFLLGASAAPKLLQLPVAEQTMLELG